VKIAILGAGISGTTLARLCAADGHAVTVLEKHARAGGLCRSQQSAGYTFDEAGGHIMFSKKQDVMAWMIERCGGESAVTKRNRETRIRWHDRYVPYPFENGVGHLPKEVVVECMDGYIESYVQRRLGKPCPADFAQWIDWRMGPGFAKHFMVPYNQKIWKCADLAQMSSSWVAGRVPEAPVTDILKAAVGLDTQGYQHQAIFWFPLHGGFESLVRGTVANGGFKLVCGHAVTRVARKGSSFEVDGERFDLVVNTVPLPQIEPAIADLPDALRADIRALRPISLVNVLIGVKLDAPLAPLSWIYLPFAEQGPANRVTFFSNYSPNNAPPGHGSYMAEVTHRGDLVPTPEWRLALIAHLDRAGVLEKERVVHVDHSAVEYAYISYDHEFDARIARVRGWFDASGYITFGRFGRYDYHNSDQCIARAQEAHAHVREISKSGAPARPVFAR
jgi:protoporphyrinogen oxidase